MCQTNEKSNKSLHSEIFQRMSYHIWQLTILLLTIIVKLWRDLNARGIERVLIDAIRLWSPLNDLFLYVLWSHNWLNDPIREQVQDYRLELLSRKISRVQLTFTTTIQSHGGVTRKGRGITLFFLNLWSLVWR